MTPRRLRAVLAIATVATILAPVIAEWAQSRLDQLAGDQLDDQVDDDGAKVNPDAEPGVHLGFPENGSESDSGPVIDQDGADDAENRAESDSEAPSAPAEG